jgi:hypothetical protein
MFPYSYVAIVATQQLRGGPKNNRNLNVAGELEVVARCAAWRQTARVLS